MLTLQFVAPNEPPPSLAAFRQMPPPSPSQQQPQTAPYPGQRGGPPPPFSSGRELPGLGSTPRHGAGMSISSILGTDSPSSQPANATQHSPTASTQSPSSISMHPPSPRRGQNVGSRIDYGQNWRRPQTPEKHPLPGALRASEGAPYSASSSPRVFPGSRGSPEYNRSGPPLLQHLYQSSAGPNTRLYQSSPNDPHEREQQRQSEERVPPRPNSQPAGFALPPRDAGLREVGLKDAMAALASRPPPVYGSSPFERRPAPEELRHPATSGYGERNNVAATSRDRPITAEPTTQSVYSPPHDHRAPPSREPGRDEAGRENLARREDYNQPFRTGFRSQYYQPLNGAQGQEAPRSHPQGMDPFRRPNEGPNPPYGPDYRAQERPPHSQSYDPQDRRTSEPRPHGADMQFQRSSSDSQPLMMQRSRSSLGIGPEGKRGRASPLPQAVQGAQAQLVGPGADPSIKSEFGRIFQGLGGIGGHLAGISTPPRQSPVPRRHGPDVEPIVLSDGEGAKMTRINSKGPKKGRRVKEEDGKLDNESNDGRGTPLGSGARGAKRSKVSHHHHLHQHNHA
jgi:hypothetical protein